jgi:mannose-1-phosphate guanylyltransferase/mannose-6-phosphate isomerase
MNGIHPTILCGGVGARLWPLSRADYPKQFLPIVSDRSMLQETVLRVAPPYGFHAPVVVAAEGYRFIVAAQLQDLGIEPAALLLEPQGRNTAPAIAVAAFHLSSTAADALMLVLPADHHIASPNGLRAAVAQGVAAARAGALVTFGIAPTRAETGYGYIRRGHACPGGGYTVDAFVEKPDSAIAEQYLASGQYFWNAGIFLFRADRLLEELKRSRPDIHEACKTAVGRAVVDRDFVRLDSDAFQQCPAESIDHAVFESCGAAHVVPADVGWSDIGSWQAVWESGQPDGHGNVSHGDVFIDDCRDCMVRSDGRLVAVIGLDNVVVVETADAMLVVHRERTQDVKKIVGHLHLERRHEHLVHSRISTLSATRPPFSLNSHSDSLLLSAVGPDL